MANHLSSSTLFSTPQKIDVLISVIIPVKDEADSIPETLDALRNQLAKTGEILNPLCFEVLLLTNNCGDNSFNVVKDYQDEFPSFNLHLANIELPSNIANIGTVRRLLMDSAYNRFMARGAENGIIASTDGDTEVDAYWVSNIQGAIKNGNDAVGGRIFPKNIPESCRLYHLQDVCYKYYVSRLDAHFNPLQNNPWPRHFQFFGASMAVTCAMYERAGGLPNVPFLEDEEFRKALCRVDARIRMCPEIKVYTSARLKGKVEVGFSEQLEYWVKMQMNGEKVYVKSIESLIEIFKAKHKLKNCWQNHRSHKHASSLDILSNRLKLKLDWLEEEILKHEYFGVLWEKVEEKMTETEKWDLSYPLVPIEDAIKDLRHYFSSVMTPPNS